MAGVNSGIIYTNAVAHRYVVGTETFGNIVLENALIYDNESKVVRARAHYAYLSALHALENIDNDRIENRFRLYRYRIKNYSGETTLRFNYNAISISSKIPIAAVSEYKMRIMEIYYAYKLFKSISNIIPGFYLESIEQFFDDLKKFESEDTGLFQNTPTPFKKNPKNQTPYKQEQETLKKANRKPPQPEVKQSPQTTPIRKIKMLTVL